MNAIEKHIDDIKRYQSIVQESDNPYIVHDYSKAVVRLKRELKTYCKFRGFNYKDIEKLYKI